MKIGEVPGVFTMRKNRESEVSSWSNTVRLIYSSPFEIFYVNTTFSFIGMQMTLNCICFVNHLLFNPEINQSKLFSLA